MKAVVRTQVNPSKIHTSGVPRPGVTRSVVPVVCGDGLLRIRLSREVTKRGDMLLGPTQNSPGAQWAVSASVGLIQASSVYLDGLTEEIGYGNGRVMFRTTTEVDVAELVKAQTKSSMDFGRLESACTALVQAMDRLPPDAGEDQMESILRSYQGVLAWMNEARERLTRAEGQVDVVQARIMQRLL